MPFADIGWQGLLVILLIVLVIFGAGRVPEIGRAMGKGIREFKTSVTGDDSSAKAEAKQDSPAASEKQ